MRRLRSAPPILERLSQLGRSDLRLACQVGHRARHLEHAGWSRGGDAAHDPVDSAASLRRAMAAIIVWLAASYDPFFAPVSSSREKRRGGPNATVTFVGRGDHFQLWDPQAFARAQAEAREGRKQRGLRSQ